jgi:hypothetical protein
LIYLKIIFIFIFMWNSFKSKQQAAAEAAATHWNRNKFYLEYFLLYILLFGSSTFISKTKRMFLCLSLFLFPSAHDVGLFRLIWITSKCHEHISALRDKIRTSHFNNKNIFGSIQFFLYILILFVFSFLSLNKNGKKL